MSFFQNLFSGAPANPALSPPVTVPASLPKIPPPTAAKVCEEYKPESPAKEFLTPQLTPSQYIEQVQKQQLTEETVKFIAYGLLVRESVWWAVECARKVSNPLHTADHAAIHAASAWVKDPTEAHREAAAAAAAKTDFQSPGAWAAQAAAWTKPIPPPPPPPPGDPVPPPPPRLPPHAVVGAVLLAIAVAAKKLSDLPKPPAPLAPPAVPASPAGAVAGAAKLAAGAPGALAASAGVPGAGAVGAVAGAVAAPGAAAALPGTLAAGAGLSVPGAGLPATSLAHPTLAAAGAIPANPVAGQLAAAQAGAAAVAHPAAGLAGAIPPGSLQPEAIVKKQLSAQEKAEWHNTSVPFIKLGLEIAGGGHHWG